MNSRLSNISRNVVWGFLGKAISLLLPFISRTVMISYIGMEYVGLNSLFVSVLQVLSVAELGVGAALVFSMYKPLAEGNTKEICALLNLYKKTYRIIGILILTGGVILTPFISNFIKGDVPQDANIYIIFCIYVVNSVLGYFLYSYRQSLLIASQRVDILSKIALLIQIFIGVSQIFVLVLFRSFLLFVIILPITTILNNILVALITFKLFPQYKCLGKISSNEFSDIKKQVCGMAFQKLGGIVLFSVDTLVISSFLGLVPLALYQNYCFVFLGVNSFFEVIQQALIPSVGNSIASNSVDKNYGFFKKLNFVYIWLVILVSCYLICLYQSFITIWIGKENLLDEYLMLLFVAYFFVFKWCDMLYVFQEATGIWWKTRFIPSAAAFLNLILNFTLVKYIGLAGILISTIVSVLFIYNIFSAKILFKSYFSSIVSGCMYFWKSQIKFFAIAFVCIFVCYCLSKIILSSSLLNQVLINIVICTVLPNLILYAISRRSDEFQYVIGVVKTRVAKILH